MQTYTYYTVETERPTTKLTAANVKKVFTAPTVLVKISRLHLDMVDGVYKASHPSGVLIDAMSVLRSQNRVFGLLEKKGIALGALAEDFFKTAEYVLFTRNNVGVYNISLHDGDFGLPFDIVNLLNAIDRAIEAKRRYGYFANVQGLTEKVTLEVAAATTCLKHAIMVSRAVPPGEHPTTINTRERYLEDAMTLVQ